MSVYWRGRSRRRRVRRGVILLVGTTAEWESEGFDRVSLALPAEQDELVTGVAAVNSKTVVVVNAGAPVEMAWAERVPAVVQAWFGGQEMARALVEVLSGSEDPGGRLPVTFPTALELTPAHGNFPAESGEIRYGEGLLVGYRWYESRGLPTCFPFGHGLSYSTFLLEAPTVPSARWGPGEVLDVSVTVTNTGSRSGCEVVQCYVEPPTGRAFRPHRELKAFAKVRLAAGESAEVVMELDGRSFARWDPGDGASDALLARLPIPQLAKPSPASGQPAGWRVDPGSYTLHIGRSSADTAWQMPLEVEAAFLAP